MVLQIDHDDPKFDCDALEAVRLFHRRDSELDFRSNFGLSPLFDLLHRILLQVGVQLTTQLTFRKLNSLALRNYLTLSTACGAATLCQQTKL